jgi:hypothetical protein
MMTHPNFRPKASAMKSPSSQRGEDPSFSVAVEDRFVIFRLNKPDGLLPEGSIVDDIIRSFRPLKARYTPLLDLSGVTHITNDLLDFASQWRKEGANVIVDRREVNTISQWIFGGPGEVFPIDRPAWKYSELSYAHFLDSDDIWLYHLQDQLTAVIEKAGNAPANQEEWERDLKDGPIFDSYGEYSKFYNSAANSIMLLEGEQFVVGTRYLNAMFAEIGRNSLLTQIAFVPGPRGQTVQAVPLHAHALYNVAPDVGGMDAILARPGALASMTQAVFSREFAEFNHIVADLNATENDLQRFFERNDVFIRMLGYKRVYPKIILERDDGTNLIPDFIIEPIGAEWCDILDIKLPSQQTLIGSRDRKDFASSVHQLHAQLREYATYFDEEKYRKRVFSKYGLRAYKPKLIGIIGNNLDQADDVQIRRVMTQYDQFSMYTYEQLRRIASQRLLV